MKSVRIVYSIFLCCWLSSCNFGASIFFSKSTNPDAAPPTFPSGPTIELINFPVDSGTSTPEIHFPIATDESSGIDHYEAKIVRVIDDSTAVDWTPVANGQGLSGITLNTDEPYFLIVRAVDGSGNASTSIQSPNWIPGSSGCSGGKLTSAPYASGAGTYDDPYLICTATQFAAIAQNSAHFSSYFKLAADLNFTGVSFSGIGSNVNPFKGRIFGENRKLKNITINVAAGNNVGLINYGESFRIDDLIVQNITVNATTSSYVAALVGYCEKSQVVNIQLQTIDVNGQSNVGAVFGSAYYCDLYSANLSGEITGTVENVGGITGSAERGAFYKVQSSVFVNAPLADQVGGIIGEDWLDNPRFQSVIINANIIGDQRVGGFIGANSDGISFYRSSFTGNITGSAEVGGFAGANWDSPFTVYSSFVNATITGGNSVGGFSGAHDYRTNFYDSYFKGTLIGTGLGQFGFGGFWGTVDYYGNVNRSYADVTISSNSATAGGAIGEINLWDGGYDIQNSFTVANVNGKSVTNSVSLFLGLKTDPDPFVGNNSFYWSGGSCNNSDGGGCNTTYATAEPTLASFYDDSHPSMATWNFTNIWVENPGALPTLNWTQPTAPSLAPVTCGSQAYNSTSYNCDLSIIDADLNEDEMIVFQKDHTCLWMFALNEDLSGLASAAQAGQSCKVSFVVTDGQNSSAVQTFNISVHKGLAIAPTVAWANHYFDYSFQGVAAGPKNQVFTLTNNETTTITGLNISGLPTSHFLMTGGGAFPGTGGTCTSTLAAGQSCTVAISFDPPAGGQVLHNINFIYSNAAGAQSQTFGLQGFGI